MNKAPTVCFRVYGIVQGVGFRPTVDRHALTAGIRGSVCNKGPYVEIIAQGSHAQIERFGRLLREQPPRRAAILKIDEKMLPDARQYDSFSIIESEKTSGEIYISPDIAICEECERELYDPSDRRYLHPFINCTCCGPRMTILDALPYDRERTSMKMFPMCRTCAEEYHGPWSRRYDAQPVCCNDCGPEVYLLQVAGPEGSGKAMQVTESEGSGKAMQVAEPEGSGKAMQVTEAEGAGKNMRAGGAEGSGQTMGGSQGRRDAASERGMPDQNPGRITRGGVRAEVVGREAITAARRTILEGGIVAVKGIGGFHLCCDATSERAVSRLRERKRRPARPFAVMMRDEETVRRECIFNEEQRQILTGHQKPVLLLERRPASEEKCRRDEGQDRARAGSRDEPRDRSRDRRLEGSGQWGSPQTGLPGLAPSVAPGNPRLGVMLPYAPLHHLLFTYDDGLTMPDCLVMTSGNVSGAPICRDDADALAELSAFCDCILSHDRLIRIRADDSVMDFHRGHPYMIRRSRGYAPLPVLLTMPQLTDLSQDPRQGAEGPKPASGQPTGEVKEEEISGLPVTGPKAGQKSRSAPNSAAGPERKNCVLAVGGELKNTFCIGSGNLFYLSPYVGDLEDLRTVRALQETIGRMETLLEVTPQAVVCDLHPKYNATMVAEEIAARRKLPLYRIQHHYAHVLSCMAENDRTGPVIGVSFDGTGYGGDGTIWGGEIMTADYEGYDRKYSITPFLQIGGDSAPRQGWRIAASMIWSLCKGDSRTKTAQEDPAERYFSILEALSICDQQNARAQRMMAERGIQAVTSTSAGRLFDGVSAMLGICRNSTYEGEASIELEFAAGRFAAGLAGKRRADSAAGAAPGREDSAPGSATGRADSAAGAVFQIADSAYAELAQVKERVLFPEESSWLPTDRLFSVLLQKRLQGEDPEKLAWFFHVILADLIVEACVRVREASGIRTAALTGGCYQNRLLLSLTEDGLRERGIEVLIHHLVPPNDGGIALGQAAAVMMRLRRESKTNDTDDGIGISDPIMRSGD